ncbi:ABCB25 [Symbiodinium sp. CCMP2592]|nr:ABCB25 [Symbiodinium sp. CCMP2592]
MEYESVTSDILTCCIVRVLVFPLMAGMAGRVYRSTEAHGSLHEKLPETGQEVTCECLWQRLQGETQWCFNHAQEKSAFEMKCGHALLMKRAHRRKEIIMLVLFAIGTGMSIYSGIKCVVYHYDARFLALEGTLQASILAMINVEYFMLKKLLNKFTEEQGELIPHVHMHQLFFEMGLKFHNCEVCRHQMKGPHYVAYRCRTCDFNLCPRCYKQKDKHHAKGFGARGPDGEQITTWTYFKRILQLSRELWPMMVAAVTCLLITQALQIFAPDVQGSIFDGILAYLKNPEGGRSKFEYAMLTYVIINFLQGCFSGFRALAQELVQRRMACSVRSKLFASVVRMDIAFFDTMHTGQLISRLTNDVSDLDEPLSTLMNDLLANLLLLVGSMFMAFHTSWKLSVLALTIVPPISYSYRAYATWARNITMSMYCAYGEANSTATDAISNIRTVRGFAAEEQETLRYLDSINTALGQGVRNAYVGALVTAFSTYLNLGTAVLILWYGGQLVCDGKGEVTSVGSLITFQLYWNMMNGAFLALGNVLNQLIRSSSAAERVFSLMEASRPDGPNDGPPRRAVMEVTRESVQGHLQLRDIYFHYRSRPATLVLQGVHIDMPPGTTTALVGKSGGGKSTLIHLLMRFYDPTAGEIFLDGRSMTTLSSRSVRRCCGFVAQETQLFSCTIVENLAYGIGRDYTLDEVVEACRAANAHEFILEMEEGYDTQVGEKGVMLSGGQRQRLAIARCFLRKPRMLFLDEATSALDAENEAIVQCALESLLSELKSTVVLIAHRLSTVINATSICVVQKGRIVEHGNHEDLVAAGGFYAQLVSRQLSRNASAVMDSKEEKTENLDSHVIHMQSRRQVCVAAPQSPQMFAHDVFA